MAAGEDETEPSDERTEPLGRNPDADPVRLHREYVQQRLGGGALPTPEAYERALDQWHRLPGAVRGPAAELHPAAELQQAADQEFAAEQEFAAAAVEDAGEPADPETYDGPLPATDPGDNRPYERRRR